MSERTVSIKDRIYENDNYFVHVVRMPDMDFDTYGVINKYTGVLEQLQPNLYNAKFIADQFHKWLLAGPDSDEDVDPASFLSEFRHGGKTN